ncbi:hypothetical protein E4H12_15655 [Candidatus Thorarchaeota archaeon]|nr:MAG: hypothetical protein E4H12_15655 [Candidatus Thorarchaeota archaeon]HUW48078.1 hypothetical protein [Patescibacteria group bacterium]
MKKVLIGIHGKPRAGKDTLAKFLKEKYVLLQYGPSVPVKEATAAMFDVPVECFYDDAVKDTVNKFWGISYREMAQKVGKESSRDIFGEDFWMRHVEKVLTEIPEGFNGLVFADIRYANEVDWIKKHGGLVIFVTREFRSFVANEEHAAERGLPLDLADVVLPNNGTIQELYDKADLIVEPLL